MTTVDLTLGELCAAIFLMAWFETEWTAHRGRMNTERARRMWLARVKHGNN